jgi:hypothetical protein
MDANTQGYLAFVVLGAALVVAVGQLIIHAGRVYLEEVFPEERTASSVSRLLAVLFYLFALGILGIISTMPVPVDGQVQVVITKLGVVLLVLGIVYGGTMLVLNRIRARREEETMLAEMHADYHTPPPPVGQPPIDGSGGSGTGGGTGTAGGATRVAGSSGVVGTTGIVGASGTPGSPGAVGTPASPGAAPISTTDARLIGPAY